MDLKNLGVDVGNELSELGGDPRLGRRTSLLLQKWQKRPGLGFPQVFENHAELEAAYRFFNNPGLRFEDLLEPHSRKTVARCQGKEVLVVHDTSTFVFAGKREDLGFINKNNRGFLGHFALAVSASGPAIPLGVVAAETWTRSSLRCTKGISQHQWRGSEDCESHRWLRTAQQADAYSGQAGQRFRREADHPFRSKSITCERLGAGRFLALLG